MSGDVTRWLDELRSGADGALEALIPHIYDELRVLARSRMRLERTGHTLDTTALVHEAYVRLSKQHDFDARDRGQFFGIAATVMRRVLVDHARSHKREKRGGGSEAVPLDDVRGLLSPAEADELLALDDALVRLAQINPRGGRCIEMSYFVGLEHHEIADVLRVSTKTVQRDLAAARAWLRKEVRADLVG